MTNASGKLPFFQVISENLYGPTDYKATPHMAIIIILMVGKVIIINKARKIISFNNRHSEPRSSKAKNINHEELNFSRSRPSPPCKRACDTKF
ncbi:5020_t:CDS:2, partial [Funneliformis geosporum]